MIAGLAVIQVAADEFRLRSGAAIRGERLNGSSSTNSSVFVIQTETGGRITLAADQVVQVTRATPFERQYRELAANTADTATSHWDLAEWCRTRGLTSQRRLHLDRVVELDADHVRARRALGFSQIGGRWVTQSQVLREKGYVFYRGRWRLSQEVALLKQSRHVKQAESQWHNDLRTWREELNTEDASDAVQKIQTIRDPHAIPAIGRLLRRDRYRQARILYVGVLGKIEDARATTLLLAVALSDPDEEVFHASVEQIVQQDTPPLVRVLAELLKDGNNSRVNRAAYILGEIGDRAAIAPLIDALVTTHYHKIPGNRRMTYSFSRPTPNLPLNASAAAPALVAGSVPWIPSVRSGAHLSSARQPQAIPYQRANQQVLDALVRLAGGVSFGYDQLAWQNWHALQQRDPQTSLR